MLGAPIPKEAPKKAAPPAIVGEWQCEGIIAGGRAAPGAVAAQIVFEFTADGKFRGREAGRQYPEGTYSVAPAKDPPEADYKAGGIAAENKAIYKVEKDVLTFCFTEGGGPRPAAFDSPLGSRVLLLTFKRVEKKKD